jgi:hypothetical protein
MQGRLVAMLLLAWWVQKREDQGPPPVAAREVRVIRVMVGDHRFGQDRQVREIALEIPAPPARAEEDDEPPLPRPPRRLNINTAAVAPENFDRWLFADGGHDEPDPRRILDDILRGKVEAAAREHRLTDSERAKVRLAGQGDIKRFFDRVEDRRRDFERDRHTFRAGYEALLRLDDLARIYRDGPFGDGSLFAKTLHKIRDVRAGAVGWGAVNRPGTGESSSGGNSQDQAMRWPDPRSKVWWLMVAVAIVAVAIAGERMWRQRSKSLGRAAEAGKRERKYAPLS